MAIFKINNMKTKKVKSIAIKKEKYIQELFEKNLEEMLDIYFLKSEYTTSFGGRIDTLGIDKNGAPVIIEYKKTQNDNVINQGLFYLTWLLDHKAEFEKLVNAKTMIKKIDWESPRVICIAESYNKFDLDTAVILPINIELLKFKIYENNIINLEPEKSRPINIPTSKIFKENKKSGKREKKQYHKSYTLKNHFKHISPKTREIYESLNERIIALDDNIIIEAKAKYIAYKLN